MTPKKCSTKDCDEPRFKRFKYCIDHLIKDVIAKKEAQRIKYKEGLETMRKNGKNNTTSEKTRALKLADSWFSKYIRLRSSYETNGVQKAKCYTCENEYPIVEMDCGHFQKRQYMATRFHLDNARPQCTSCNDYNKGRYEVFDERLINEIGKESVERLKELAKSNGHTTIEDLKCEAGDFKRMFNELLKHMKISNPWK